MRTKYFLLIVFGILACTLVMDGLAPVLDHDSNLAYAAPRHHPRMKIDPPPPPPQTVPEPSTLILLGMGVTGIGVYLYSKRRIEKK